MNDTEPGCAGPLTIGELLAIYAILATSPAPGAPRLAGLVGELLDAQSEPPERTTP